MFPGSGGFAGLGGNLYRIAVGPGDTIKINPNFATPIGSGLNIFGTAQGPVSKLFAFENSMLFFLSAKVK